MRQSLTNLEVRPTVCETLNRVILSDVQCVTIARVNFGEGFDQVGSISLIPAKACANRMSIDSNMQAFTGNAYKVSKASSVLVFIMNTISVCNLDEGRVVSQRKVLTIRALAQTLTRKYSGHAH